MKSLPLSSPLLIFLDFKSTALELLSYQSEEGVGLRGDVNQKAKWFSVS